MSELSPSQVDRSRTRFEVPPCMRMTKGTPGEFLNGIEPHVIEPDEKDYNKKIELHEVYGVYENEAWANDEYLKPRLAHVVGIMNN